MNGSARASVRSFVGCIRSPTTSKTRGEVRPHSRSIADPVLLDDARKHLRRKGDQTIEEARRLDQLYAAVTDLAPPRSRRKQLTKRDMVEGASA